jgi:drug/metabolite transporter (DMT)-like permease
MKRLRGANALQVQAWVGAVSGVPLLVLSLLLEPDAFSASVLTSQAFWLVQLFSVALVSIMGHVFHYQLVRRYDVSVVAALTLFTPLSAVFFGVTLAGEELRLSFIVGASIACAGALVLIFERRRPPR